MSRALQEIAPGLHIVQHRRARFDEIISPLPGVIRVEAGEKRLRSGDARCSAAPGSFAVLADHIPLSIENLPPTDRAYAATVLAFPRASFEAARARLHADASFRPEAVGATAATPDISDAFEACLRAFQTGENGPRLDLLCERLALELALAGVCLPEAPPERMSDRLRSLLAGDLSRAWTAEAAARALGTSPATMRRRLNAEGQAFHDILRELRLASGLHLLQTTQWTVASVAEAVGYSSASRFTQRFRMRFGLSPGDLRKPPVREHRSHK